MRFTLARELLLLELVTTLLRDHAAPGRARRRSACSCSRSALHDRRRDRVAPHRQHGVARAGGPGGGRHRELGARRRSRAPRRWTAWRARRRRSGRSPRRARTGCRPRSARSCSRRAGAASAPMRITCASLDRSEPFGFSRSSTSCVTAGSSPPSREQDRRADRAAREHRGRDRRSPSRPCRRAPRRSGGRSRPWRGRARWPRRRRRQRRRCRPPGRCCWVAVEGKPSFSAACSSSALAPSCGGRGSSSPVLQPTATSTARARNRAERRRNSRRT